MMKLITRIFLFILILFSYSYPQGIQEFNSTDEAMKYLRSLVPKDSAFIFHQPTGWKSISLSSAKIIQVSDGEDIKEAEKIIDGKANTSWKTKSYYTKPEVVIDLGSKKKFDVIVIYNRQSMNRGSGGGNDAVKTIEISYSNNIDSNFIPIGAFELNGPSAVCVKIKGGHQFCTFIDNPKPNIINIPLIDGKYLKLKFIQAFWGENIPDEWRDSFSLTEVMLFNK